jgi:hypothetical protein
MMSPQHSESSATMLARAKHGGPVNGRQASKKTLLRDRLVIAAAFAMLVEIVG